MSDLRPYCEEHYLDDFDEFAASPRTAYTPDSPELLALFGGDRAAAAAASEHWILRNAASAGAHDVDVRLADLDRDGVAGEVVFHGTPEATGAMAAVPFSDESSSPHPGTEWSPKQYDLNAVGRDIYNRWLVDFCSTAPARHAGLCQIPVWDIDRSVAVVRWAAARGLRGVNFPHPQWSLPAYDDPSWDPLFATCAELGMPLVTHIGGGIYPPEMTGPGSIPGQLMENPYVSGRNLWHLIFCGVFDRHPDLSFVVTEVPGPWFTSAISDMDTLYDDRARGGPILQRFLAQRPSEYVRRNVYLAFSFMSRAEAHAVDELGLVDRAMWGSDYPHPEGTWLYHPDPDDDVPSLTRLSLANTFAGFDEDDVRKMVGGNAIDCYGLDAGALARIAEGIGPTVEEITTEPDLSDVPDDYTGLAFRTMGAWR